MRIALIGLALLVASPAAAQRLIAEREQAPPFHVSNAYLGPIEEGGALLFFARDLARGSAQALRVDATSIVAEAAPHGIPASVAACGGARWMVTSEVAAREVRYEARAGSDRPVWSRAFPLNVIPGVTVRCVEGHPLLGFVEAGELFTVPLERPEASARARLWPAGQPGSAEWIDAGPTAVVVAAQHLSSSTASLVRFEGSRETHRVELGRASTVRLARQGSRAVVAYTGGTRDLVVTSFALDDLRAGPAARVSPRERASIGAVALHAGPRGLVAVAVVESWIGDGFVAIPQGPNEPDRFEPEHVSEATLRIADVASGALGPPFPLDAIDPGGIGWLGDRLVVLTPVQSAGVVGGQVQLRPSRLRRFRVER